MKKFVCFLFSLVLFSGIKANATTTFENAYSQCGTKPMLVLIYADWADNYKTYLEQFKIVQREFGDTYNYVELNIANKDTKNYNRRYRIYPNLPYVMMYRNSGKISRFIPQNCAIDSRCMIPKIKSFITY